MWLNPVVYLVFHSFWKIHFQSFAFNRGVDVEAIKQQIKDEYQKKKARVARKHMELNIQFEKRADVFSLFISKVVNN